MQHGKMLENLMKYVVESMKKQMISKGQMNDVNAEVDVFFLGNRINEIK